MTARKPRPSAGWAAAFNSGPTPAVAVRCPACDGISTHPVQFPAHTRVEVLPQVIDCIADAAALLHLCKRPADTTDA